MPENPLYQPLPAGQIRLLTILKIEPDIECRLDVHTISELSTLSMKYNALSYVWGSQPASKAIHCNGKPLDITPSLSSTLIEIFAYDTTNQSRRPIWIDAICLNQKDPEELKIHVPLMSDVYSKASLVLVYLGSAGDDSDLAMTSAAGLVHILQVMGEGPQNEILSALGIDEPDHPIWRAVANLIARPWFYRVWTVQEAILAKGIVFGCGSEWIPWEVLFGLATNIIRKSLAFFAVGDTEREIYDIDMGKQTGVHRLRNIGNMRRVYKPTTGLHIFELLAMSRSRHCKEPVDHIWGCLALMPPQIREMVQTCGWIDYTAAGKEHFWNTYIKFAKSVIRLDTRLHLLSTARSEHRPLDLPSWCPNWASPEPSGVSLENSMVYCSGFTDHRTRHCRITVDPDSDRIHVPGFRVDTVDQIVEYDAACWSISGTVSAESTATSMFEWESSCSRLSKRVYQLDDIPEEHRRTLIGDELYPDTPCGTDPEREYNLWLEMLKIYKNASVRTITAEETYQVYQASSSYYSAVQRKCLGRAFFSTDGGRVGLGPPDMKKGDVICVFYSGGPVYIIRFEDGKEEGKDATLVGDAYVHGLMKNGEAFGSPDRGSDEDFVLV
jgi:hypothetical protein